MGWAILETSPAMLPRESPAGHQRMERHPVSKCQLLSSKMPSASVLKLTEAEMERATEKTIPFSPIRCVGQHWKRKPVIWGWEGVGVSGAEIFSWGSLSNQKDEQQPFL